PDVDPRQAQRFLHIIHDETLRLTRLLDGILDLSGLERGGAAWTLVPTDPQAALAAAPATCEGLATAASVRLLRPDPAPPVRVLADADRLSQVFINLVANAIKYNTSPAPWVRVSSRVQAGRYRVLVEDNGPGIRPELRAQLFRKF